MRRILLKNDIEVLVASYGGVGTTFLMDFIRKYKKVNDYYDADGLKHSPLPPISRNKKVKVIYVYGDPILATVSLFRRGYHHDQSKKLVGYLNTKVKAIPLKMTLDEYASQGIDRFFFKEHFYNYFESHLYYPTFFVKYEKIFDVPEQLLEFLELPKEALKDFPKFKKRSSTLSETSNKTLAGLKNLYGNFHTELERMNNFEIRKPNKKLNPIFIFFKLPYFKALIVHFIWSLIAIGKRNRLFRNTMLKTRDLLR